MPIEDFSENKTVPVIVAAFNCIDDLLSVLANYIEEDEIAEGYGAGCYGNNALDTIKSEISKLSVGEYVC